MGGLKRKIDTEKKVEGKKPRAVTFSKRRKGLFSKAAELCLLSDAQIAILATPVSSNSHNSFYTFGHSSVDSVVAAFLAGQTPTRDDVLDDDEKLGFWWEDESLANSENAEELGDAIDSMKRMLHDLKELQRDHQHVLVEKDNNNNNASSFTLRGNDDVGEGCSNFDQIFDSVDDETQSQVMPMINLDDDDFFSSDFFNEIDIDALYYASTNF
ncbi:PREDICTED: agamous-like MADS-box protein AGL97 [Camelina sativa]|uniref:Agamous-like MADS-box protein AGL97 n=1 Tax=Camelina sativa TaxID=90675 RepID=A0ABM0TTJ8_CAMSA|nr:PREDICTED: agamous-like MADS-box protein AGL97 [Camelina sativa]XP_010431147.1 PREDICTED: agamous-like MADS-box protein AGL97 [Camelina sativa]XP_010431165.1 PREDICTED: agamous-like MADS-box protein AGL97 [Camelina sativa]